MGRLQERIFKIKTGYNEKDVINRTIIMATKTVKTQDCSVSHMWTWSKTKNFSNADLH